VIVGIGIDIIEVERVIEKVDKDNGFRERIFSRLEIDDCERKGRRAENYAGRFVAKEAFLKATGLGLTLGHALSDIEVSNDEFGKPCLTLHGSFQQEAGMRGWAKIHLSITHISAVAAAVVVIEL
jgi:holo-[acyl-carrier protein] synthase